MAMGFSYQPRFCSTGLRLYPLLVALVLCSLYFMSPRIYQSQQKKYCKHRNESKIEWCHENRLWANSSRPWVALVSYPGSGNTWMRYLLQQSTGILTGSVFPDPSLKKGGFGEGINNRSVIVVKTHNIGITRNKGKFDRAVLLVRVPFDAILATFNLIQSYDDS